MRPPAPRFLALSVWATLALTACGGDDDTPADGDGGGDPPAAGGLVVHALDSLQFDSDRYQAEAGTIDVTYENDGSLPHTFLVEGREDDLELEVSGGGDTDSGSIELPAGTYTVYCDVAGHQAAGMEATLIVE